MNGELKKCVITRYDETITEPPFLTIEIDKVEVVKPETDDLGEEFVNRLISACNMKGYAFRFYSRSENENFDYEIVVL